MTRRDLLLQMVLCRAVDSYLCYITDLLALIFVNKPDTLRSNEQLTYDDVLQHSNMDDLISFIAEKRVLKLAFTGMRKLAADLSEGMGLDLFDNDADRERAVKIVEIRNLLTHNHGIVNRLFVSRLPDYPVAVGDRIKPDAGFLQDIDFLAGSVCDIEKRTAQKFGFPQTVSGEDHEKKLEAVLETLDKVALRAQGDEP